MGDDRPWLRGEEPESTGSHGAETAGGELTGASWRGLFVPVISAWLLVAGLEGLVGALEVQPGESLPLRWLRMVTAHPTRSRFAISILLWGYLPGRTPT